MCKNGWPDRDAVWGLTYVGPSNYILDGVQIPQGKGCFWGDEVKDDDAAFWHIILDRCCLVYRITDDQSCTISPAMCVDSIQTRTVLSVDLKAILCRIQTLPWLPRTDHSSTLAARQSMTPDIVQRHSTDSDLRYVFIGIQWVCIDQNASWKSLVTV